MLKTTMGWKKTRFRGKDKVHIQFLLTASVINLKKMVQKLELSWLKQSFINAILVISKFILNIFNQKQEILEISEA